MIVGEIISFDTQLNKNQSYLPLDPILPYLETFEEEDSSMENLSLKFPKLVLYFAAISL